MALLERDNQLTHLLESVAAAEHGEGSMQLVSGEAGAGKTSLIRELMRTLSPGVQVLIGACDPFTTPRPLSPLIDFADAISARFAAELEAGRQGVELFSSVLGHLKSARPAAVMVLEDAHWADDATLDFIRYVGRRIGDTRGVCIVTHRDDEVDRDHPLRTVVGQIGRVETTYRVNVPPLSRDAVAELASERNVDVAELHLLTGGNAFYATEVLAGDDVLPESVQDAVLARLQLLPEAARSVVEVVSIAPRNMSREDALALASVEGTALDLAVQSGVLVDDGALHFRHEIARLAVADAMPKSRRIELNGSLVTILEKSHPADNARLAHHAIEAQDSDRVLRYAPAAAAEAATRGAHRQAAELLDAAVTELADSESERLAQLRRSLADELAILREIERSTELSEMVADHYRQVGDNLQLAEALVALSRCYWRQQRLDEAWAALDDTMEILPPDAAIARAETEYQRGYLEMLARRLDPASSAIERSRRLAAGAAPPELVFGQDLIEACIGLIGGDPDGAIAALRALREEATRERRVHDEISVLLMIGSGGGEARRYDVAAEALASSVDIAVANDEDFNADYARSWQARIAFEQGRWTDATMVAETVLANALQSTGIAEMTAKGVVGRVRVRRGDPGGSDVLSELLGEHESYELQHVWSPLCGLAEHHWIQGRTDLMVDVLRGPWERALETDSSWARGEIGFWMWRAGVIETAPGAAAPFAQQISGDWKQAADSWRRLGCPYEVALALADGDIPAMQEALSIFDTLGARPAAFWLRAKMRTAGVDYIARGPIARTRGNPAGLTNRQLEVLRLMCSGLSNGEIASALFVSKKTVEHHVSAVFSKLEVGDRPKAIATGTALLAEPHDVQPGFPT